MPFSNRNYTIIRSKEMSRETAGFMNRVYLWMTAGIALSGLTAYYVASNANLMGALVQSRGLFIGLFIAQIVAVIALSGFVQRLSVSMAASIFILYAALTGVTFSTLFIAYTMESLTLAFFSTAFAFGGLSAFGFITKRDLGPIGSFCMIGLFGLIGMALLSFFIPALNSSSMQLTYSTMAVMIFAGLTAYDTQRVKALQYQFTGAEDAKKGAIYGALILYLDFINLFLNILRLFGDRR